MYKALDVQYGFTKFSQLQVAEQEDGRYLLTLCFDKEGYITQKRKTGTTALIARQCLSTVAGFLNEIEGITAVERGITRSGRPERYTIDPQTETGYFQLVVDNYHVAGNIQKFYQRLKKNKSSSTPSQAYPYQDTDTIKKMILSPQGIDLFPYSITLVPPSQTIENLSEGEAQYVYGGLRGFTDIEITKDDATDNYIVTFYAPSTATTMRQYTRQGQLHQHPEPATQLSKAIRFISTVTGAPRVKFGKLFYRVNPDSELESEKYIYELRTPSLETAQSIEELFRSATEKEVLPNHKTKYTWKSPTTTEMAEVLVSQSANDTDVEIVDSTTPFSKHNTLSVEPLPPSSEKPRYQLTLAFKPLPEGKTIYQQMRIIKAVCADIEKISTITPSAESSTLTFTILASNYNRICEKLLDDRIVYFLDEHKLAPITASSKVQMQPTLPSTHGSNVSFGICDRL